MRRIRLRIARSTSLISTVLLAAGSILAVAAAQPASAAVRGSIVFMKNGNVWIARADGTHARQFTKAQYNWFSPSESDNGTVVVGGGLARTNPDGTDSSGSSEIYRFTPNGNQIGKPIPTWGSFSSPACPTYHPTSIEVSPDGKKIAYGIWLCSDPQYTTMWTPSNATTLDFPHQHVGQEDFYEPHWISNSTFLVSHFGQPFGTGARWFTHGLTQGDDHGGKGWNWGPMTGTGAQGLIDRSGDKLVVFEDDAANWSNNRPRLLRLWVFTGKNIPSNWSKRCTIKLNAAQMSYPQDLHPSFSPDGHELIWGDNRGIEEASLATPGNCASIKPHLLIPGGYEPFYSPASEKPGAAHPHQPGK
jgi:hypothetical protein